MTTAASSPPAGRALVYRAVLAAICLLVVATRVHGPFERIRFRIVTAPRQAQESPLIVPLRDLTRLAGSPAALIIRFRGAPEPTTVRLAIDTQPIGQVSLPAERETRVDLATTVPSGAGHNMVLDGSRSGWQLTYLEFSNVYGFTRGLISFEIVPADSRPVPRLPWGLLVPIAGGILALAFSPDWPFRPRWRAVHRAGLALVLLFFATTLIADRVSPYKLLVSLQTFLFCVAVLYAEAVVHACRSAVSTGARIGSATARSAVARSIHQRLAAILDSPRLPAAIALALTVGIAATALLRGVHLAAGSDSYGYVSQSELWARGQLFVSQPIVRELPVEVRGALVPLGYTQRPGAPQGELVPTYSPGLPMLMAVMRVVAGPAGPDAVYVVVPALAGLTIWCTFLLGRRHSDGAGLLAACWIASSPAFLVAMLNPMSDVPVTAWWALALVAMCRSGRASALIAGAATSLAVLTRPNLAPLGAIVALPFAWRVVVDRRDRRSRAVDLAVFALSAAAGPITVAFLFKYWYGSPLTSGYGPAADIFSWSNVLPNLHRYPRWLLATETPLLLAALGAPFVTGQSTPRGQRSGFAWLLLAFSVLVWVCYLGYSPFESWEYLRFVLPSFPPLAVLASAVLIVLLRRTAAPAFLGAALGVMLVAYGWQFARHHTTLNLASGEARYRRIADIVARSLPDRAVLLTMQHSGSLRYYSGRLTIRYDFLPPERLDEIVAQLEARGFRPYIVLDNWEEQEFRKRFEAHNRLGALDWPAIAQVPGGISVAIYDPRDVR